MTDISTLEDEVDDAFENRVAGNLVVRELRRMFPCVAKFSKPIAEVAGQSWEGTCTDIKYLNDAAGKGEFVWFFEYQGREYRHTPMANTWFAEYQETCRTAHASKTPNAWISILLQTKRDDPMFVNLHQILPPDVKDLKRNALVQWLSFVRHPLPLDVTVNVNQFDSAAGRNRVNVILKSLSPRANIIKIERRNDDCRGGGEEEAEKKAEKEKRPSKKRKKHQSSSTTKRKSRARITLPSPSENSAPADNDDSEGDDSTSEEIIRRPVQPQHPIITEDRSKPFSIGGGDAPSSPVLPSSIGMLPSPTLDQDPLDKMPDDFAKHDIYTFGSSEGMFPSLQAVHVRAEHAFFGNPEPDPDFAFHPDEAIANSLLSQNVF